MSVEVNGKSLASVIPPQSAGNAPRKGNNTITLTQTRNNGPACHVMYDYVALELP